MANQAAWLTAKQTRPLKVDSAPMPEALHDQLVIKTHAVAINPVDAGIQSMGIIAEEYPFILGCDIAGEVTSLGTNVKDFHVGDRVIACAGVVDPKGNTPTSGSFQLYCAVQSALAAKLSDNIAFTDGCVIPVGLCTAATSLFGKENLALDFPRLDAKPNGKMVVIWGASSSVGSCAVQMAKAAGYEVAATASPHNFDYCHSLGADHVFDHRSQTIVEDVVIALKGKDSAGVFDAVMPPDTILKSAQIADRLGGNKFVNTILPPPEHQAFPFPVPEELPAGVKLGYCWGTALGNNEVGPAVLGRWLSPALANGSMKCKPDAEMVGSGLGAIQGALDKISAGVSAKKLVVKIV